MSNQDLNTILNQLSCSLTIPQHIVMECNQKRERVFNLLQAKSHYKLDRCRLAGGTAKKTSIMIDFDLDCVIYINNQEPPFDDVLDEWEDILTLHGGDSIEKIEHTRRSVQFSMGNYKFDLLPAANYAGSNHDLNRQAIETWHQIRLGTGRGQDETRDICGLYSSGLSELAVQFLKNQSSFIHGLCRLAKFWNKTVYFDGYISGRSSMIEALAVKAGQEEEIASINGTLSTLRGFRRFLSLLKNHRQIAVIFKEMYPKEVALPPYDKPHVIDPSNPYNNFLAHISPQFLPTMAQYAEETLARLDRCEKNLSDNVLKLFYPQPDLLNLFNTKVSPDRISTAVGIRSNCAEKMPELIIRRESFDKRTLENIKELIECVMKHIHVAINTERKEEINERVTKATEQFFDRSFYHQKQQWKPSTVKHDEFDITFVIPLHTDKNEAVFIGMSNDNPYEL